MNIEECQELIELSHVDGDSQIIHRIMNKIAPPNIVEHVDGLSMLRQVVMNNPHADRQLGINATGKYMYASDGYRVVVIEDADTPKGMYDVEGVKIKDIDDELSDDALNTLLKYEYNLVGYFDMSDVTMLVEDGERMYAVIDDYRFHHNHLFETLMYQTGVPTFKHENIFLFSLGDVCVYLTEMTEYSKNG